MKKNLKIEGMMCNHCKSRVEKILSENGVTEINVSVENGFAEFEDNGVKLETIKDAIRDAGFDC